MKISIPLQTLLTYKGMTLSSGFFLGTYSTTRNSTPGKF